MLVLANNRNIILAGRILRFGGVIVYPTDTAYALGGIFDNEKVVAGALSNKAIGIEQKCPVIFACHLGGFDVSH